MPKYRVIAGFTHTHSGTVYDFPEKVVVQSSSNCDPENGIANLEADPPLVRESFIEANPLNFKKLKKDGS